jgi:hypothetical protein
MQAVGQLQLLRNQWKWVENGGETLARGNFLSRYRVMRIGFVSLFAFLEDPNPFGRRGGLLQGSFYLEVSLALVGVASPA